MSYDHLNDESKTIKEGTGFTQINNHVINHIKNGDAFLVWCYLYSKTSNWKTIKSNIKNVYGFGDLKLKQIFSYLHRANLIKYVQTRGASGTFAPVQIRILNGAKFDKTQAYIEDAPVVQKPARAVHRTNGNDELRNKENTKERKEHNTESNSATEVAQESKDGSFDEFWKVYPIKKNKVRAKRIWDKKKFSLIVTLICHDVMTRCQLEPQWQDKQYIPHPSTYLGNELWNDEITPESISPNRKGDSFSQFMNQSHTNGATYDQHGNVHDPLR